MFNGWMELSVDRHVITRQAVYSLATPVNSRVSLGIGSGPPGTVYVRNADGSLVTSASIGAVTVVHRAVDVRARPDDSDRTGRHGERQRDGDACSMCRRISRARRRSAAQAWPSRRTQPGQNATLTFSGSASRQVTVNVTGNTMSSVTVKVLSSDQKVLASTTSSAASFALPAVTLPSTGVQFVIVDPIGSAVGTAERRGHTPPR